MYGLKQEPEEKFAFDLEREIKSHPGRAKELAEKADKRIHEIKHLLREGANEKDFDRLGILLHGYTALTKVLKKLTK
jgi:hypothetical protein